VKDNIIGQKQLEELCEFSMDFKSEKMSKISDSLGKNLVSQLLNYDKTYFTNTMT
jgi:hypothetical protein